MTALEKMDDLLNQLEAMGSIATRARVMAVTVKQLLLNSEEVRPDVLLLIGTYPDGPDVILGVFVSPAGADVARTKHQEEHGGLNMSYRIDAWAPED